MEDIIKPFEKTRIEPGVLTNTGVRLSKSSPNDLNSCMFDVNIENALEEKKSEENTSCVVDCFNRLQKLENVSRIRLLMTFELTG